MLFIESGVKSIKLSLDGTIEVSRGRALSFVEEVLDVSLLGLECLPGGGVGCRNFVNLIGHELIILTYSFINK